MNYKQKILIGVYTCPKFSMRADGIRDSWLKLVPDHIEVLFVLGRPGREASIEGDRLYLDCQESYEKLPEKTLAFLNFCASNLDFDYIFKVDDDTYIDMDRFLAFDTREGDYIGKFCSPPGRKFDRTWHFGKCNDKSLEVPDESEFICDWMRGAGYFLSPKAVNVARERITHTARDCLFEDKMIGEALTMDPSLKVVATTFEEMGILNPLLPDDMQYVQNVLLEKRALVEELALLRQHPSNTETATGREWHPNLLRILERIPGIRKTRPKLRQ